MQRRRQRRVAGFACLSLSLTGCVAHHDTEPSTSTPGASATVIDADWSEVGGSGYVYLHLNTADQHYELFRADLSEGSVHQLTDLPGPFGISNFSVSPAGLVVADASTLSDEAKWLQPDGTLDRLPGQRVLGPVVNERGDVLASLATRGTETIAVLPHDSHHWSPVQRVRGWTVEVWLDDETAALVSIGRRRTTWSTLTSDGQRGREQVLSAGRYGPGAVTHHGQPIVMASIGKGPGLLWRPGRRPRVLPPGWDEGCVSPDGSRLLLWSRGRLGVLDVADLDGPVREIGTSAVRILGCGWVEERFGP